MTEPTPTYKPIFPTKGEKLLCRIHQVANQRKGGDEPLIFTVVVYADGRWQLIPPPPAVEHLGRS